MKKNQQLISKNQRWKLIFLITIAALLVGLAFNYPVHSADMDRDIQRLLFGRFVCLASLCGIGLVGGISRHETST